MYCHQCGTLNDDQASFCRQCGASLKPVSGQTAAPAAPGIPTMLPITVKYAGFWKRFAAYFLDMIIVGSVAWVVSFVIGFIIGLMFAGSFESELLLLFLVPVILILDWLYFALMESSSKRATLGKMALGIIVTDLEGKRISFGRATGRFFSKILSGIIIYIGFIMVAFTDKKQGLHDMTAGTLVIAK
jgi:uncharacterized RDD family membrane protein YckC